MSMYEEAALDYAAKGYPVFPCLPDGAPRRPDQGKKSPIIAHGYKNATTNPDQIRAWWKRTPQANVAIAAAGLLVVDVDVKNGSENDWDADPERAADLAAAPIARTPRGGRHYVFRDDGGQWRNSTSAIAPQVDTRADGGYILTAPSAIDGQYYEWLSPLPHRDQLPPPPAWLEALNPRRRSTTAAAPAPTAPPTAPAAPAGDFARAAAYVAAAAPASEPGRNDALNGLAYRVAERFLLDPAEVEYLLLRWAATCSPPLPEPEARKTIRSAWSAAVQKGTVGAKRTEPRIRRDAATPACGWTPVDPAADGVDLSGFMVEDSDDAGDNVDEAGLPLATDAGPLPVELLRVPGFISEVMDYTLETAPYPNQTLAFVGALAMQAHLGGRKVRDERDNRTNLYLLGLAQSGSGKDRPRKVNVEILHTIGQGASVGERFASGEGLEDALQTTPAMLFQPDEIDGLLQSINKAKDARHEGIMGALLRFYTTANSVFMVRRRAGDETAKSIDQPCLVLFGTAIPQHFYAALSERMLTNGFFGRTLIFESEPRSEGQEPRLIPPPTRILEAAKGWTLRPCGTGNLANEHPTPRIVDATPEAARLLADGRKQANVELKAADTRGDVCACALWSRASESARKLALIYAISERPECPRISAAGVRWASEVVTRLARGMLAAVAMHAADGEFEARVKRVLRLVRGWHDKKGGRPMPFSKLSEYTPWSPKDLETVLQKLENQGSVLLEDTDGRGGRGRKVRLLPIRSVPFCAQQNESNDTQGTVI